VQRISSGASSPRRQFWASLPLCFVIAFLTWAARGKSFNLVGMLSSSLVRATPIALAALTGVISERTGIINIGIEGMMLMAAQIGGGCRLGH
jgi:general nucleoside transport system permease protein